MNNELSNHKKNGRSLSLQRQVTSHAFHPKAVNEYVVGRSSGLLSFITPSHSSVEQWFLVIKLLKATIYSYGDSTGITPVSLLIQTKLSLV
jgi:hypothetical protein